MNRKVNIEGMHCGHCAAAVKEELGKIDGVSDVVVDVQSKTATFNASRDIADDAIIAAVDEAGFEVAGIE